MFKNVIILAIVSLFIFSAAAGYCADRAADKPSGTYIDQPTVAGEESTKDRLSRGMNNLLYGPVETPKNMNETQTKGTKVANCDERTRTGLERGIARVFTGVWQLATFWYSDPGCVTSTKPAANTKGAKSGVK